MHASDAPEKGQCIGFASAKTPWEQSPLTKLRIHRLHPRHLFWVQSTSRSPNKIVPKPLRQPKAKTLSGKMESFVWVCGADKGSPSALRAGAIPGAQTQRCEAQRAGESQHRELGANRAEATKRQRKQNRSLSTFGGAKIPAGFSQCVSRDVSEPAKTAQPCPNECGSFG